MKVSSSLHKSVLGFFVFLHTVAALDAVQLWQSRDCRDPLASWLYIHNGNAQACLDIVESVADGPISWVPFAAENRFILLYTLRGCRAQDPAVVVRPGSSTVVCFVSGGFSHIGSIGALDTNANNPQAAAQAVDTGSLVAWGMQETPTNVDILFGNRLYTIGPVTLGIALVNQPVDADFVAARDLLRHTWMTGAPVGTAVHTGRDAANYVTDYVVQYFGSRLPNPYLQYDGANGDLIAGLVERLYYHLGANYRCQGTLTLNNPDSTYMMTVSVSFC